MDVWPGLAPTDNVERRPPWRPLVVEMARHVLAYTGGTVVLGPDSPFRLAYLRHLGARESRPCPRGA